MDKKGDHIDSLSPADGAHDDRADTYNRALQGELFKVKKTVKVLIVGTITLAVLLAGSAIAQFGSRLDNIHSRSAKIRPLQQPDRNTGPVNVQPGLPTRGEVRPDQGQPRGVSQAHQPNNNSPAVNRIPQEREYDDD